MTYYSEIDSIVAVNGDPYASWKIQKRNEWMVDNSDAVITVWNGSLGGTTNTVNYARNLGESILVIGPVEQTEKRIMN